MGSGVRKLLSNLSKVGKAAKLKDLGQGRIAAMLGEHEIGMLSMHIPKLGNHAYVDALRLDSLTKDVPHSVGAKLLKEAQKRAGAAGKEVLKTKGVAIVGTDKVEELSEITKIPKSMVKGKTQKPVIKALKGEGSHGGKIVGHYHSGKPIYESDLARKIRGRR